MGESEPRTQVLLESDLESVMLATPEAQGEGSARSTGARRSSFSEPASLFVGRDFGGFRAVQRIASGGMASVLLARKDGPGFFTQHAAIKVIHPHLSHERNFIDMFLDEARIAACAIHPNVCRVLDFGMAQGTYYLAMEYVLGETWSELFDALGATSEGLRARIGFAVYAIAQACEGLHAAHEASDPEGRPLAIVHRDISPPNVVVAYDGSVRVLDFGIARAADRITSTRTGVIKGHLAYMAPEQMRGEEVSPATDVWALGVLLREAIEGKRLFRRASEAQTMEAVTLAPLPAWSVAVAPALDAIVARALSRDLSMRYPSARELGLELTRFAATQTSPFGAAEASGWMHRLFSKRLEEKRRLLSLPAPDEPPAPDDVAPFELPDLSTRDNDEAPSQRTAAAGSTVSAARLPTQRAPRRLLLAGMAAVLICAGFAAGKWLLPARPRASQTHGAQALPEGPTPSQASALTAKAKVPAPSRVPRPAVPGAAPLATSARPSVESAPTTANPPETPARKRLRTGNVVVAVRGGWAEVYWDNKLVGTTPAHFSLPEGRRTLALRPFGRGPELLRVVEVRAGETTKVQASAPPRN